MHLKILWFMVFPVALLLAEASTTPPRGTYRAAVLEHAVVAPSRPATSRREALTQMMVNLRVYRTFAAEAGRQKADIFVFPEVGLTGFTPLVTREAANHYYENIPDPSLVTWTPCDQPQRFLRSELQTYFSCIAKDFNMYVMANLGDAQSCVPEDPRCPADGRYQFNTNVVYNRKGQFIAKYHKLNLYKEPPHDRPATPEYVYFDTDFGRVGVIICFDALFHEPTVSLIEEYNVTDVVFPIAWPRIFPYFTPIGYHSAFAVLHRVNLLAANLRYLPMETYGSGIYTPDGADVYRYDMTSSESKMLISDVKKVTKTRRFDKGAKCAKSEIAFGQDEMYYLKDSEFKSVTFGDWTDYVFVTEPSDNVTLCKNNFCCYLSYEKQTTADRYAFGIFNGIHGNLGPFYLQVCSLVKCAGDKASSCGQETLTSNTHFRHFQIKGSFSSKYVYPQILLANNGTLALADKGSFQFGRQGLIGGGHGRPLIVAALTARVYHMDGLGNVSV